jgi:hypothetical protein
MQLTYCPYTQARKQLSVVLRNRYSTMLTLSFSLRLPTNCRQL